MRKYFVILLFVLCLMCRASATEGKIDTLSKIENSVLGVEYSNQKTEERLTRLEEYVYGTKKKGNTSERMKKLAKDLNADVIGQEIPPSSDTFDTEDDFVADSSVDYPIINDVEKKLKISSKPSQSLHSRLVAIEKNLFKNVYDTDDFYTRVERIKGEVYKNSDTVVQGYDDLNLPEYSSDEILNGMVPDSLINRSFSPFQSGRNCDNNSKLAMLEKKILKSTYPDESENDRLTRLENCMFDTDFYYDDTSERINRLEGAVKGRKSADRYDNNKLQQRLNTAMQIGAMILMVLACIL